MACFLVPATEAIITTAAAKVIQSKEKEKSVKLTLPDGSVQEATRIRFFTFFSGILIKEQTCTVQQQLDYEPRRACN